jgi:hypothetical protein
MRLRWSVLLPLAGLVLFTAVSYQSSRVNDELQRSPNRYYWWSSLRLDTDPLNRNPRPAERCKDDPDHCASWDVSSPRAAPGWLDKVLVVSAFPAFLAAFALVLAFGRQGTSEVLIFMVVMPTFLFGWYYFIGRLIERWFYKRARAKSTPLKMT